MVARSSPTLLLQGVEAKAVGSSPMFLVVDFLLYARLKATIEGRYSLLPEAKRCSWVLVSLLLCDV